MCTSSRAGFAQIHDAGARGRAAHDGIIHHDDAFSFHRFLDQIKFYAHIEIANELTRLEKRAPNVVIANKRVLVRNFQLLRKAERGVVS